MELCAQDNNAATNASRCVSHPQWSVLLTRQDYSVFQSRGLCTRLCWEHWSYAILYGTGCWCSDTIPDANSIINADACKSPCPGYPYETCGGGGFYVYLSLQVDESAAVDDRTSSFASSPSLTTLFSHSSASSSEITWESRKVDEQTTYQVDSPTKLPTFVERVTSTVVSNISHPDRTAKTSVPAISREMLTPTQTIGIATGSLIILVIVVVLLAWTCHQKRSHMQGRRQETASIDEGSIALGLTRRGELFVVNPD